MLKHEFEELIGYKVTDEIYNEANAIYMNAGEMTKEDFCKEWLKIGNSPLVRFLSGTVDNCRATVRQYSVDNETLRNRNADLLMRISKTAAELIRLNSGSSALHDIAIDMIGHRAVLRIILADQLPLYPVDYEELAKYLPAK